MISQIPPAEPGTGKFVVLKDKNEDEFPFFFFVISQIHPAEPGTGKFVVLKDKNEDGF